MLLANLLCYRYYIFVSEFMENRNKPKGLK